MNGHDLLLAGGRQFDSPAPRDHVRREHALGPWGRFELGSGGCREARRSFEVLIERERVEQVELEQHGVG
jgi:hypothetical protein